MTLRFDSYEDFKRWEESRGRRRQAEPKPAKRRQRTTLPPGMKKTEETYLGHLELQKASGRILGYVFEPFKLWLTQRTGKGTKRMGYTPDFLVVRPDPPLKIVEVKGPHIHEDSELKFKMAAELHPWFEWEMVKVLKTRIETIRHLPATVFPVQRFPVLSQTLPEVLEDVGRGRRSR